MGGNEREGEGYVAVDRDTMSAHGPDNERKRGGVREMKQGGWTFNRTRTNRKLTGGGEHTAKRE